MAVRPSGTAFTAVVFITFGGYRYSNTFRENSNLFRFGSTALPCQFRGIYRKPDERNYERSKMTTMFPGESAEYRAARDRLIQLRRSTVYPTSGSRVVDVLGLWRPLVLGYSDGGQIALELGMRYPGFWPQLWF
jgi:pimeloyl-ACP methyl ester carboxylesterase